jgi:polar amino acid transport system permease protein
LTQDTFEAQSARTIRADLKQDAPMPPRAPEIGLKERLIPLVISFGSVIAFFGIAAYVIGQTENWPLIRRQFFSLEAMIASFPAVLRGFWLNMTIWLLGLVLVGLLGLLLAVVRSMKGPWFTPIRLLYAAYVDFFRGVPTLLLVLLFGFGIPALALPGLPNSSLFWGGLATVMAYAAYAAEVYRSGIDSVHDGQRMAAKSLGLTQWQTMIYAILPQAVRNVIPSMMNLAVAMQKDVALLSVLGIRDAVREAQIYTAKTFNYSSLVAASLLFLVASIPLARLTDYVTRKDRERRLQGGA